MSKEELNAKIAFSKHVIATTNSWKRKKEEEKNLAKLKKLKNSQISAL